MLIGAQVRDDDPLTAVAERKADVVQFFLSDPQGWKAPKPHPHGEAIAADPVEVFIHSPYLINVASLNNKIRIPSRKNVTQHADGAAAIGAKGLDNWRKLFEREQEKGGFKVPILIENTAGGENAMTRDLDVIARLWDKVGEFGAGFCLDTCHAFAAGWDLATAVGRVKAITGRIDLVHLNNSRDEFGSTRDRHANVIEGEGTIDPEVLVAVAREAGAPVVVETPADGQAADIAYLREQLG